MNAPPADRRAVVLLSGGLDSATVAAWLKEQGYRVYALSVDYGQRHAAELDAARAVAEAIGVEEHLVQRLDLRAIGGSALTADIPVPKERNPLAPVGEDIPVTYVPARNTVFLSLALAFAEARGVHDLGIGVNALDYSGYPDCRPEFIEAFGTLANLATREGVEGRPFQIHAPLQNLGKLEILQLACELGVPIDATLSCYDPDPNPCGHCEACRLRLRAEAELRTWNPCELPIEIEADVPAELVHPVRHRNLRADQPFERAIYADIDDLPTTKHWVARLEGEIIGCATLLTDSAHGVDCRVRGMAVDEALRGQGIGVPLLRACMEEAGLRGTGIWCNARTTAVPFYARCGFRRTGEEFDMPDIGPHYALVWPGPRTS
jgi:7-cyano-7-deazaguanine synthase